MHTTKNREIVEAVASTWIRASLVATLEGLTDIVPGVFVLKYTLVSVIPDSVRSPLFSHVFLRSYPF